MKKVFYDYLDRLEEIIEKLVFKASICTSKDSEKKKESCIDGVFDAIIKTKLGIEELLEIYELIKNRTALNLDFFFNNPSNNSLWSFFHPKVRDFAKNLFIQTPKGLGTPNAAPGEGELMFCLLHPDITKPTKGDLCVSRNGVDHIFELKGDLPRVNSDVKGIDFCKRSLEIAKKYGIKPNKPKTEKVQTALELEKSAYNDFFQNQLNVLPSNKKEDFIWEWLNATGGIFPTQRRDEIIRNIFPNGKFDQNNLQKEIVKGFYAFMCENDNFESMILLGDGNIIKIIPRDPNIFNDMVDRGLIELDSDYFRIAQPYVLGWYIK